MSGRLRVVVDRLTPRVGWVLEEVLVRRLGVSISVEEGEAQEGALYVGREVREGFRALKTTSILYEERIYPVEPQVKWDGRLPVIFPVEGGLMPFDVLGACFFVLSLWDEHFSADGCPPSGRHSWLYRSGLHRVPVVDLWARHLGRCLVEVGLLAQVPSCRLSVCLTYDVDRYFKFYGRGWLWHGCALVRDVLLLRGREASQRLRVLVRGREADPFWCFDELIELWREVSLEHEPLVFLRLATRDVRGEPDPFIPVEEDIVGQVAAKLSRARVRVGWHPNVSVSANRNHLEAELQRFKKITGVERPPVRFHFLRLKLPAVAHWLTALGIEEDYSLGWAEVAGWRAGTAYPFRYFDLERNEPTQLLLHPIALADFVLKEKEKFTLAQALEKIYQTIEGCRATGGQLIFLWHNSTALGQERSWKGWRQVHTSCLRLGGGASVDIGVGGGYAPPG